MTAKKYSMKFDKGIRDSSGTTSTYVFLIHMGLNPLFHCIDPERGIYDFIVEAYPKEIENIKEHPFIKNNLKELREV
ncbi:MAG TPA: hypothetical protein VJB11_02645 [archaeon]|nr:hypothetical protein [archaeon]